MIRNYRIVLLLLLASGILLIIFVGFFLLSLYNARKTTDKSFDAQTPPAIGRRIDSGATRPTLEVMPPLTDFTEAIDVDKEVDDAQKKDNPDVYIYNRVPFENQYFRIEGTLRPDSTPHFSFTVTLKGQDKELSKVKLNDWLIELGLTTEQASALLIEYR